MNLREIWQKAEDAVDILMFLGLPVNVSMSNATEVLKSDKPKRELAANKHLVIFGSIRSIAVGTVFWASQHAETKPGREILAVATGIYICDVLFAAIRERGIKRRVSRFLKHKNGDEDQHAGNK